MDNIKKHLDQIRSIENKEVLSEAAAAAPAAKAAGKFGSRLIPGLGVAAGAYDAYQRAKAGDWAGAALGAGAGLASLVPGVGTAVGAGLLGAQMGRDKARTGSWLPDEDEIAAASQKPAAQQPAGQAQVTQQPAATTKLKPGADPKVVQLQQQLVAKGAKITVDGFMGPKTQAAMKQFPDVAVAESKLKETKMSESDKIAALKAKLELIENQQTDEGALSAIKNFGKGAWAGMKNLKSPQLKQTKDKAGNLTPFGKGASVGSKIASRPAVAAMGAAGAAAALSGGDQAATPAPAQGANPGNTPAKPTGAPAKPTGAAPAGGLSAQERSELDALAAELEAHMGRLPELDNLLLQHQKLVAK